MSESPVIVDVRQDEPSANSITESIPQQIIAGLKRPTDHKNLPTLLLYNERGLRLYDDITTEAPEYYLFAAEEEILKAHADDIVQIMHSREGEILPGEVVVELGAGYVHPSVPDLLYVYQRHIHMNYAYEAVNMSDLRCSYNLIAGICRYFKSYLRRYLDKN